MRTPSSTEPRRPDPGDIAEFSFLWSHEQAIGLLEGSKPRRCVVVAVLDGGARVVLAPITSTEPSHPHKIALRAGGLGLTRPSWIVTSELNVTVWPGPDLRPASRPVGAWWLWGRLSDPLRQRLADEIQTLIRSRKAKVMVRSD